MKRPGLVPRSLLNFVKERAGDQPCKLETSHHTHHRMNQTVETTSEPIAVPAPKERKPKPSGVATREQWLESFARLVEPILTKAAADAGLRVTMPPVKYSVGWPKASKKAIGQCWPSAASGDKKTYHVFISPNLQRPNEVDHVMVHEMVHALVGNEHGHKGPFVKVCKAIGLVKPWTATTAGPALRKQLDWINSKIGEYPHPGLADLSGRKKQTTRMVKLFCATCGFVCRASRGAIEQAGLPECGCGGGALDMDGESLSKAGGDR